MGEVIEPARREWGIRKQFDLTVVRSVRGRRDNTDFTEKSSQIMIVRGDFGQIGWLWTGLGSTLGRWQEPAFRQVERH